MQTGLSEGVQGQGVRSAGSGLQAWGFKQDCQERGPSRGDLSSGLKDVQEEATMILGEGHPGRDQSLRLPSSSVSAHTP